MSYCVKCNLFVNTDSRKCPLCYSILSCSEAGRAGANTGESLIDGASEDYNRYPELESGPEYRYNFVVRLLLLLSIASGSTSLLVNILTYSGTLWSLIVVSTILFLWVAVAYPLLRKKDAVHFIVIDVICTPVFLYIIQATTHSNGWVLDIVTPFLFISATLAVTFIICLKRMKWREYSLYQTIVVALGFLPVIFYVSGLVAIIWPSIVSAFYSFLTLTGMLIFVKKKYKDELIKRFHV